MGAAPPLLTLRGVSLSYGGEPLLSDVALAVAPGDRICLVGRNGSGKSTLLRVLAGVEEPDAGERFVQPGTRAVYLEQEPRLRGWPTVRDAIAAALPEGREGDLYRVDALLDGLQLDGEADPAVLSGGEGRRVVLARALIAEPELLLLDEPTNHLDLQTIAWLEDRLDGFKGAFVVVSHDRAFLNRLTRRTLWIDRGQVRTLDAGFAKFEAWADEVLEQEAVQRERLDKLIEQETAWARRGIPARRKRNLGRLRRLRALREERRAQRKVQGQVRLDAPDEGIRSGKIVLDARGITKAYGDRTILEGLDLRVLRGDRLGIIGPNGAGKTTLLRILTGDLKPDAGTIRHGSNLVPLYIDQQRADLDPEATLWSTMADASVDRVMVRGHQRHVVAYLQDFLFTPDQARAPVGTLSGGERNRLLLAKHLARPSNLLILDEPTNDLDVETLDLLQEVLAEYEGTLLLVSHDRDFLDRVVTSTLVLDGEGGAIEYAGGYSDYVAQRRLALEAAGAAEETARRSGGKRRDRPKVQQKLSFKQVRELEALPEQIEALETEVAEIEANLADGDFYARDPAAFEAAAARLDPAKAELEALEERWLELESLREELEAAAAARR